MTDAAAVFKPSSSSSAALRRGGGGLTVDRLACCEGRGALRGARPPPPLLPWWWRRSTPMLWSLMPGPGCCFPGRQCDKCTTHKAPIVSIRWAVTTFSSSSRGALLLLLSARLWLWLGSLGCLILAADEALRQCQQQPQP